MNITEYQVGGAFEVASKVFAGEMSRSDGINLLHSEYGLNQATSGDFINDYKCLMEGRVFHRAMSINSMRFFFVGILNSHGQLALLNAIKALNLHIEYWEGHYKTNAVGMRSIVADFLRTETETQILLDQDVQHSLRGPRSERLKRLSKAARKPEVLVVQNIVYKRNPDVVAEVLFRADGKCEVCKAKAPFLRLKDGSPYLEVHHKIQLSNDGDDTVENALALCPNCHRQFHYGIPPVLG